jgi:hypothetical protein
MFGLLVGPEGKQENRESLLVIGQRPRRPFPGLRQFTRSEVLPRCCESTYEACPDQIYANAGPPCGIAFHSILPVSLMLGACPGAQRRVHNVSTYAVHQLVLHEEASTQEFRHCVTLMVKLSSGRKCRC